MGDICIKALNNYFTFATKVMFVATKFIQLGIDKCGNMSYLCIVINRRDSYILITKKKYKHMENCIYDKMAGVGCGKSDTNLIAKIVKKLTDKEQNVLDAWHNIGFNIELKNEYANIGNDLKQKFSDDDIICLSAFVSAYRNVN